MIKRILAVLLAVVMLAPPAAFAQEKAGVVTTLEGNVKARRIAHPDPVDLKFKDDVYMRDTVLTGDKSLARMLLGGKAVVTVRERSVLTITEIPGRPTVIDLDSGKFALAVAREKMRPGEEIQIRTPNAVAGVRGTVVITEVERQGAQVGAAVPAAVTNFYVLRGEITAQLLDANRNPFGSPFQIGTMQNFSAAGLGTPRVQPVLTEQIARITSGLQPTGRKGGGDAGKEQVKAQQQQQAVALLSAMSGETPSGQASAPTYSYSPGGYVLPYLPDYVGACGGVVTSQGASTSCEGLLTALNQQLGFSLFSSDFTSTSPFALFDLINQSLSFTTSFIKILQGINVLLAGPLVHFTNSTVFTTGSLLDNQGGFIKSTSPSAFISSDPTTLGSAQSLILLDGGSLTLASPLLTDVNGTIVSLQDFLEMSNGATLTSTGTGALVQLNGTSVFATSGLSMTNSTMTLAGPLVTMTNVSLIDPALVAATLQALGLTQGVGPAAPTFLLDNSRLTSTGAGALIQLSNTDFDSDQNFIRLVNGSTLTLSGPLLSVANSDIFTGDPTANAFSFLFIGDGSQARSTSTSPFMTFTNSNVDTSGNVFSLRRSTGTPTRLTLAGPLLSAANSTFNHTTLGFGAQLSTTPAACCNGFFISQGAQLSSTTTAALIQLTSSTFIGNDSQSGGNFFEVGDSFTGAPSGETVASSSASLAGPLLGATNSTITSLFDFLQVQRSSFTSTTTSALVSLTGGTVTLGGNDVISGVVQQGQFLHVFSGGSNNASGTPALAASASLAGPLVNMTGGARLNLGGDIVLVRNGGTLSSTTLNALITINGSFVTQNPPSSCVCGVLEVFNLGGPTGTTRSSATLSGPLLSVLNGGTINYGGRLLFVDNGGTVIESHPTLPFASLDGGAHSIAANVFAAFGSQPAFFLRGRSSNTITDTDTLITSIQLAPITIGTDQPLQRSGSGALLQLSNGATLNTRQAVFLDTALFSATAPLLDLTGSTTTLTTASDAINLNQRAKLTATGPMFRVNASTMNINGAAVRVAGGSGMVATDLFSVSGGGRVNITGGPALFVSGGSVVNITGFLVNFTGTGNQVNITNNLCNPSCFATSTIPSLNIQTQNGAALGPLLSASGIAVNNLAGNTFSVGANSAVIVIDGANSVVKVP